MGREVFRCECGEGSFLSSTDNRSYTALILADQDYDAFSEQVDRAIETARTIPQREAACLAWRAFPLPRAWQCPHCGSLYVETPGGTRERFLPAEPSTSRQVFKR